MHGDMRPRPHTPESCSAELRNRDNFAFHPSPKNFKMNESRRRSLRYKKILKNSVWTYGHYAGEMISADTILVRKSKWNRIIARYKHRL